MSEESNNTRTPSRVRWGLVFLCLLIGTALVVLAALLAGGVQPPREFWAGVLVSIGTAVLLVAVLFWLERSFIHESRENARVVASAVASETARTTAEAVVKERTSELSARLDVLGEQIEKRREERSRRYEDLTDRMDAAVSWSTLLDA